MYNREQVAQRAEASKTNTPGYCQMWSRTVAGGVSVGDFDGDGDADAVDGWKQSTKKHPGDRNPPRGTIVSFSGGSKGYGHRAISLGAPGIRSTDMSTLTGRYAPGVVGTVSISEIEKAMGVKYLGWSEDISGVLIPLPPAVKPPKLTSRGKSVDEAIARLKKSRAKAGTERRILIDRSLEALIALPFIK